MDTFDLYGDLEEFQLKQIVKEKDDAQKDLQNKYECAMKAIIKLQGDVEIWKKKCSNIEKSFWSLLETCKAEISRKDKQLDQLKTERDDIAFRRVKPKYNTEYVSDIMKEELKFKHNKNYEIDNNKNTSSSNPKYINPFSKNFKKEHHTSKYSSNTNDNERKSKHDYLEDRNDLRNKMLVLTEKSSSNKNDGKRHGHGSHSSKTENKRNEKPIRSNDDRNKKLDNYKTLRDSSRKNTRNEMINTKKSSELLDKNKTHMIESREIRECKKSKDVPNEKDKVTESHKRELTKTDDDKMSNIRKNDLKPSLEVISKSLKSNKVCSENVSNDFLKKSDKTSPPAAESLVAKSLISELNEDLKTLRNKNDSNGKFSSSSLPIQSQNEKQTFEDILFDEMICGNQALEINDKQTSNSTSLLFENLTHDQISNVEDLRTDENTIKETIDSSQYSSEQSQKIPPHIITSPLNTTKSCLDISITSHLNSTLEEGTLLVTENERDLNKSIDSNKNVMIDFDSNINCNDDDDNNEHFHLKNMQPTAIMPKYFGSDNLRNSTTTQNNNNSASSIEKPTTTKHTFNKSAEKIYELYLESPAKNIPRESICTKNFNDKRLVVDDKNETFHSIFQSNEKKITANGKKLSGNRSSSMNTTDGLGGNGKLGKLIGHKIDGFKRNSKKHLEATKLKDDLFKEILTHTNDEKQSNEIVLEIKEINSKNDFEKKSNSTRENGPSKNFEMHNFNEQIEIITNEIEIEEECFKEMKTPNCKSIEISPETIITPFSQQETLEATTFLSNFLLNNNTTTPSKLSPLKLKMKLLFDDTPQQSNYAGNSEHRTDENNETETKTDTNIFKEIQETESTKILTDTERKVDDNLTNSPQQQQQQIKDIEMIIENKNEDLVAETIENTRKRKSKKSPKCLSEPKKIKLDNATTVMESDKNRQILKTDQKIPNSTDQNDLQENINLKFDETKNAESNIITMNITRKRRRHKKTVDKQMNVENSFANKSTKTDTSSTLITRSDHNTDLVSKSEHISPIQSKLSSQKLIEVENLKNILLKDWTSEDDNEYIVNTKNELTCSKDTSDEVENLNKTSQNNVISKMNSSTPTKPVAPQPVLFCKKDEELFDCVFKSPYFSSQQSISFDHDFSGNSDNSKYNKIEQEFQQLFGGKSPTKDNSFDGKHLSIKENMSHFENNNNLEESLNSTYCENEKQSLLNSNSSMDNSNTARKKFSTSSREYEMEYDANEGVTVCVIKRKRTKKKRKTILK